MKKETTKKERDMKKVGLVIAATAGTIGTIGLGALCVVLAKDNKNLKLENSINKEAFEELAVKFKDVAETAIEQSKTIELVKDVVGGKVLDRLITNEEKVLSRIFNKKNQLIEKGLDKIGEKTIEDLDDKIKNSLETIADFKSAKDALRK